MPHTTTLLLGLNTALLFALLVLAGAAYHDVAKKSAAITEVFTSPTPSPAAVAAVSRMAKAAVTHFILGAADGQVSDFITGVLTTDFASIATAMYNMSTSVQTAFQSQVKPASCYAPFQCQSVGWVTCPTTGMQAYCGYVNQIVNCATQSCLASSVITGASFVASVASVMVPFQQVSGMPVSGMPLGVPAMSDGVFRLDLFLNWLRAQTVDADWKNAATLCRQATTRLRQLSWIGTYLNTDGNSVSWDINNKIADITQYVDQVCSGLQNLRGKH